jgi:uncharacterized protein involved in exopolysaccharide biosynthesis
MLTNQQLLWIAFGVIAAFALACIAALLHDRRTSGVDGMPRG